MACKTTPGLKLNVGKLGMPFMVGDREKQSWYSNKKHPKSQVEILEKQLFPNDPHIDQSFHSTNHHHHHPFKKKNLKA